MNRQTVIINLLLILLLIQFSSYAQQIVDADYYIDGTSGNDSNDGLTSTTAKQSISGIIALGSTIAGKKIAFRDSIIYRNTSTTETWRITQSNVTVTNWYEGDSNILPAFTGGQQITVWTNYSGNVWESSTNVSSASAWK